MYLSRVGKLEREENISGRERIRESKERTVTGRHKQMELSLVYHVTAKKFYSPNVLSNPANIRVGKLVVAFFI